MRIVVLAETGTRGLLRAVTGGKGDRNEAPAMAGPAHQQVQDLEGRSP